MLSTNFSLAELCKSQVAERRQLNNLPSDPHIVENLRRVCASILEPVRAHYGIPFAPSSGYRSPEVNRLVNGSRTSQHLRGEAADFEVPGKANYDLALWISQTLDFDQLILEFYRPGDAHSGWVHCSYRAGGNRRELLTINKDGRQQGLIR